MAITIERVLAASGRMLGTRQSRDGRDGSGITVDFTYDEAVPPVALEITSVPDRQEVQLSSEAAKLREKLNEISTTEGLGGWAIGLASHARIKDVTEPITSLMRSGISITPGDYTSTDLEAHHTAGTLKQFTEQHKSLQRVGVIDVQRVLGTKRVEILTHSELARTVGFERDLQERLEAKRRPLENARGSITRETHLVVSVERFAASHRPGDTPVPSLPPEIDVLWVLLLWARRRSEVPSWIWSVNRGSGDWVLHAR